MPGPESNLRFQTAVYWKASGHDNYGQPKVTTPVEIQVRWEKGRNESTGPNGELQAIDGTLVVDREIPIGSILWLGVLADYVSTDTKMQVLDYKETPDIKNRNVHRAVTVKRYTDTLPTLA